MFPADYVLIDKKKMISTIFAWANKIQTKLIDESNSLSQLSGKSYGMVYSEKERLEDNSLYNL